MSDADIDYRTPKSKEDMLSDLSDRVIPLLTVENWTNYTIPTDCFNEVIDFIVKETANNVTFGIKSQDDGLVVVQMRKMR